MEKKELHDAAQCALEFVKKYSGKDARTKRYLALKALADMTLADLEKGLSPAKCQYTAYDVLSKIEGKECSREDSEKKKVNRYLKELSDKLSSKHGSMLKDISRGNNFEVIPSYNFRDGEGSGSGNYSMHFITPVELTDRETSFTEDIPINGVRYYLETIDNLPRWIRWLNNFELSDLKVKFIAALMMLTLTIILFLYFIFMGVFISPNSTGLDILRTFVGTTAICVFITWPFRVLYLSGIKKITPAPILFLPSDVNNAQIESFATEKTRKSDGRFVRKLRLVSYASECPLCKSRIEVEDGGKEFHNRLIGRCLEEPIEHIYSFDRILRVGKPLRQK